MYLSEFLLFPRGRRKKRGREEEKGRREERERELYNDTIISN